MMCLGCDTVHYHWEPCKCDKRYHRFKLEKQRIKNILWEEWDAKTKIWFMTLLSFVDSEYLRLYYEESRIGYVHT